MSLSFPRAKFLVADDDSMSQECTRGVAIECAGETIEVIFQRKPIDFQGPLGIVAPVGHRMIVGERDVFSDSCEQAVPFRARQGWRMLERMLLCLKRGFVEATTEIRDQHAEAFRGIAGRANGFDVVSDLP